MPKPRTDGVPKRFDLAGYKIKVVTIPVKKWQYGEHILAMWVPAELKIEMRGDLEGSHRQQVFLHEAVHAIFDVAGHHAESENEALVDRTATFLHQMLSTWR